MSRPHFPWIEGEGRDSVLCPEGGAKDLGPRIPVLNNSVVVELHLKIKREPTQSLNEGINNFVVTVKKGYRDRYHLVSCYT